MTLLPPTSTTRRVRTTTSEDPSVQRLIRRSVRDVDIASWLIADARLIAADAHRLSHAPELRAKVERLERTVIFRHPRLHNRLLLWEANWLHAGADSDRNCTYCQEMRGAPPPVRSPLILRAWMQF